MQVEQLKATLKGSGMPWPGDESEERWTQAWTAIKRVCLHPLDYHPISMVAVAVRGSTICMCSLKSGMGDLSLERF